jgi:IcmF-related N-terminal domain
MSRLSKILKFASALSAALAAIAVLYWAITSGDLLFAILSGLALLTVSIGSVLLGLRWLKIREPAGSDSEESDERPTDPQARIAELRRSFHRGIKRFLPFGKDPHSVPWYLVVGETGAGKTEAIRHSSLGFPPGLQDEDQGAGGTRALDWWFTNQAVILDTAGEWMFGDGGGDDEDAPSEWIELFKLLKAYRPGTPLNGMILTLPAESLLKDSPEEIKAKAGKIARKLSQVQRVLEIRFPIFVMIAKCDMIVGFREFFEKAGAAEQQQMLGWSNPANVDDAYDPGALEDHLGDVFETLRRRRLELLAAPPQVQVKDDPDAEVDPVAALYAFPENLKMVLPGLRAYLEAIFLLGEWSAKPLFLRGVFFTSSMRVGGPVDLQAREMFGVPAEGPDGDEEDQGRPFFLHDMFTEKIFQEKGLVFSASSARSARRTRRALLWGFGLASIALLTFLTWHSTYKLRDEVGVERGFWEAAAQGNHWNEKGGCWAWEPVLVPAAEGSRKLTYAGNRTIRVEDREYTTGAFLGEIATRVEEPMDLPWTFRFTAEIQGDLSRRRLETARSLFESSVLCPVYRATTSKLAQQSATHWNPKASAALAEVLRIEVQAIANGKDAPPPELLNLDALLAYLFQNSPADYARYAHSDSKTFAAALQKLYAGRNSGAWPPAALTAGKASSRAVVAAGIDKFGRYWTSQMEPKSTSRYFASISALTESGDAFLRAEGELAQLTRKATLSASLPATLLDHNRLSGEWERQFDVMRAAREKIKRNNKALDRGALQKTYQQVGAAAGADAEKSFELLRELMKPITEADAENQPAGAEDIRKLDLELKAGIKALRASLKEGAVRKRIARLDTYLFTPVGGVFPGQTPVRAYEFRYRVYELAHRELVARPNVPDIFDLAEAVAATRRDLAAVRTAIKKQGGFLMTLPPMKKAVNASLLACDLAERWRTFVQIKAGLDQVRDASGGLEKLVARRAETLDAATKPIIALTAIQGGEFDPRYSPAAALQLLAGRGAALAELKPGRKGGARLLESKVLRKQNQALKTKLNAFFSSYLKHWMSVSEDGLKVTAQKDFFEKVGKLQPWEVNDGIGKLLAVSEKALTGFDSAVDPSSAARAGAVRRRVKAGRERVGSQLFANKCKDVVRNWTEAARSPKGLRTALLSMKPADFIQAYMVSGNVRETDLALSYWESLTYRALTILGDDFQSQAARNYSGTKAFRKFPLGAGDAGSLSAAQVTEAHRVFDRVRINPVKLPTEALGRGGKTGRTGNAQLDAAIKHIAVYEVPKTENAWFSAADRVLAGLPRAKPFECEIILLSAEAQKAVAKDKNLAYETVSALPIWRALAVSQGARTVAKPVKTEQLKDLSMGKALYPGETLELKLFKFPDGKPDRTVKLNGPWSCLQALHQFKAERSKDDPREWTLGLTIKDDLGRDRKIWLKLKFSRELPELANWPTAR